MNKQLLKWTHLQLIDDGVYNTLQLIEAFRIPLEHHLIIDQIIISADDTEAVHIKWDKPFTEELGDTAVFTDNHLEIQMVTTLTPLQLIDLGIEIFDTLSFTIVVARARMSFGYYHKKGEMKFQDDMAEQIAEMRKIGQIQTSPGGEFHRVGDVKVIDAGGSI